MQEQIDAAERLVASWEQDAAARAEKFAAMREQVSSISVTERSPDGTVRVTVSSNGLLRDLHLAEKARGRSMAKLAAEVMRTVHKAQSRLPDLIQEAVSATVGSDDPVAQHVLDEARKSFPEPPASPGASQVTRPRPKRSEADDDFGYHSTPSF